MVRSFLFSPESSAVSKERREQSMQKDEDDKIKIDQSIEVTSFNGTDNKEQIKLSITVLALNFRFNEMILRSRIAEEVQVQGEPQFVPDRWHHEDSE